MVPHLKAKAGALYGRHPRKALASAGLIVLLALVALVLIWLNREDIVAQVTALRAWSIAQLEGIPASLYMLTMIIAPAFGAPLSIFYVTIAAVMGGPVEGVLWACVGVALNMALSYYMAAYLCRPLLHRLMIKLGYKVPVIRADLEKKVIIIVRVSPLPFFVQNYSLGIARVQFWPYLWISVLIQSFWAVGMILLADSFFSGSWLLAVSGAVVLITAFLVMRSIQRRNERKL